MTKEERKQTKMPGKRLLLPGIFVCFLVRPKVERGHFQVRPHSMFCIQVSLRVHKSKIFSNSPNVTKNMAGKNIALILKIFIDNDSPFHALNSTYAAIILSTKAI